MSKDKSLLEGVSKYFTEKTLVNIVAKVLNEDLKNCEILSWDFGNANAKGDSYLSTVDRISIDAKVKGVEKKVKIVVKSIPNNVGRRKTYRSDVFFRNEINFYTEIASKYKKFLESKNLSNLLLLPDCLVYHVDGENDFIVLNDVTTLGFDQAARQSTLTLDQIRTIIEAMARFHSVSFAYKDQNLEDYKKISSKVFETYFSKELYDTWYKRFHLLLVNVTKDALAKEYPGSKAEQRFNSFKPGELYLKAAEFCTRTEAPTSVINQGDSWAPNFMVRANSSGKLDVLMLDFQLARCVSPILDLCFLIYSCTDKALRDQYFDDLLKYYHQELSRTIKVLGSDPDKIYPWDLFMKEVKEMFGVHGVAFGMESIVMSSLSEDEAFDLDVIKDDKVDIADVWTVKPMKTKEKRQRIAEMVVHAVEREYL